MKLEQEKMAFKKNIVIAVSTAFARQKQDVNDPYILTISDYISENRPNVSIEIIKKACKMGVEGKLGQTFGSIKLQNVCIWIDTYLKEGGGDLLEDICKELNTTVEFIEKKAGKSKEEIDRYVAFLMDNRYKGTPRTYKSVYNEMIKYYYEK